MTIRDFLGFVREVLWRPFSGVWAILTGLASLLTWFDIGEHWPGSIKVLVGVVLPLLILLVYVLCVAYSLYYTKIDRPLPVREVSKGTHYYKNYVVVILERRDTVSIGDVLTLFVLEGDAEVPICLLSVEGFTSKSFPQSVVFRLLTDEPLLKYLGDESRIEQLQAKQSVKEEYLNV